MQHDAIVVGGSYAGMAAALQLARARRRVIVIDAGERRNRFAGKSHGFLTQDGQPPGVIAARARDQLLVYPTVTWIEGWAVAATPTKEGFVVQLETGQARDARRLVLATGVVDTLPDLPGLRERWGRSIFMCPYCDGYERDGKPLGVLATSDFWFHQALLIPEWGPTTLFTNEVFQPDTEQLAALERRGVMVERMAVVAIEGDRATMRLRDGRKVELEGLFIIPRTGFATPIAETLGCKLEDGPIGRFITTDPMKETSVRGVFACGDAARAAGSVSMAVGDGAMAGTATHQSLVFR